MLQILWTWSYRWLLSHHVGDGNQTLILYKSNKHSKLLSHQFHFIFKRACVCPHVCMYKHQEVSAMVKIGGCVHMSHCWRGRREPDLEAVVRHASVGAGEHTRVFCQSSAHCYLQSHLPQRILLFVCGSGVLTQGRCVRQVPLSQCPAFMIITFCTQVAV